MALTAEQLRKNREERNKKTDLVKRMNPSTFVSNLETVINTAQDVNNNWKTPEELEDARNVFAGFLPQAKAFAEYDKMMNPDNQLYSLSKDYKSSGMSYRDFKLNHDLPTAIDNHYTNSPASIHSYVQNVMNSLGAIGERNAKYKTADAYNEAQANIKKYEAMTVEELEADREKKKGRNVPTTTGKRKSNLEAMFGPVVDDVKGLFGFGDEEKKDTSNIAYTTADGDVTYDMLIENRKRRDFEENIASKSDFEEKNKSDDDYTGKRLMAPSVEEAIYYTVNGALARKDLYTKNDQDRITNAHYVDEKQRGIFNYLWETEGSKSALAYFDMIEPTLEKQRNADFQQTMYNFGKNHEILGTLASLGTNLFSGAEAVGNGLNYLLTGDLQTNQMALATSSMRSGVSDSVDWNIGNWDAFDFVYNSTMSGIDSFLSITTFGGIGGAANLGLSAAAQGTNDALERGFSNKDAFWDGFISGILEATFEYVSIGQFNALKEGMSDGLKTTFKNIGKSMLVNASEETLTELANIAYDYIANGDFSQWEADIRKYMAQGMSESEAKNKVARENGARVLEAGASGAFMGIGFGSVSQYSSYKNAKALGTAIREGGTTSQVFDAASQMTPEEMQKYDAYSRYAKKGITAENIKDAQLGNLYSQTQQAYGQRVTNAQKTLDKETKSQNKRLAEIDSKFEAHKQGKSHLEAGERRALSQERKDIVSAKESSEAKSSLAKAQQDYSAISMTGIQSAINQSLKQEADAKKKEFEKEQKANFKAKNKVIEKKLGDFNIGSETKVTDAEGTAKVQGIKVDDENFSVVLDNGESVSVDKMTFSKSDATLIASAEQIATTEGNAVASVFIKNYDGKSDINEYRNTFEQMAIYSKGTFTEDYILKQMNGKLSTEQINSIYTDLVTAPRKAQQEALDKLVGDVGKDLGEYTPIINDSIIDYDGTGKGNVKWSSLDTRQRDAITFVKTFAKMIGANVTFTESTVDQKTGERKGENGSYSKSKNTITIDVYAGVRGLNVATSNADSIISTFSHELTHWMKEKSPDLYHKLGDKIVKLVGEKTNLTEEELIYLEMARLEKAHKGKKFTPEYCRDEIIARGCEDMLSMSEEGRRIFDSMSETEKKGFIGQVKALLNKLLEWVNNLLNGYKSNSDEARILRNYESELQELSKMWDEMLVKAVETNKALEVSGAFANLKDGISEDGTTIVGDDALQMSDRTYREGGRDFLINWLDGHRGLSEADKQDIIDQTDRIAELMRAIENDEDLPDYSNWANMEVVKDENGEKILSVIVKNGDYAMNIDFSQVCKKRVALNAVLNAMVQSGDLNVHTLTETDVADLNAIIKAHDFEIACALCFVDSKRYRMGSWAESFCEGADKKKNKKMVHQYGFNEMVRSLVPKGSKLNVDEFNFTGRDIKNQPTEKLLSDASDSELDFSLIDEIMEREFKPDGKSTYLYAYAKAIKEHKELRKILNPAEIISSIGLDAIRLENKELYRLINRHQGTARPKFSHDVVAYGNDILKATNFKADKAKMVGGVRCQSFSDFMANMVVDYAQFISELSAKELTSHTYTKEPLFVKLFGLTGMKINMSLVPKAIDMTPEQQEYFAILKDKNANKKSTEYQAKMKEYKKLAENAGLDENGNYIWEDETFPYDIAMELVVDPRYSANCGTIAVGISDKHIRKLLDDDRISMVIPYHKSSLNHEVAMMRDIALYNDYTKVQSTMFDNGAKLKGFPDFDFYGDLYGVDGKEGSHDPKKTAENYLAWCDEHNYRPKFDKFRNHPNYYKLLVDFRVYDTDGTYREQQPVKAIYPEDAEFRDLILNGVKDKNGKVYGGLKQQQETSNKLSRESQDIVDEYRARLKEKYGKDVLVQYDDRDGDTKRAEELSEDDLYYLLENVQHGILDDGTYIPLRISTPEFFIDVVHEHSEGKYNVMHVPLASEVGHLRQNMEEEDDTSYGDERPHNLSIDDVILISKEMGHPTYIVLQKNGRYAMVVSFYNSKSKKVVVSIDFASDKEPIKNYKYQQYMNGYNEGYYNIIVTQYEPDDLSKYLADNEVVYDKKKMNGRYQVGFGRIVTFTHDTPFIDNSILNPIGKINEQTVNNDDVQNSDRDTEGRTLSEAQMEYFKDSVVRDKNGNLIVCYHGTRNANFTVFKRNINFFTDSKDMADSYSPNGEMFEGYLNIKKPYEIDAQGEKWSRIPVDDETKKFLQDYGASVFKEKGKWRTTPADIASAIEEAVENGDVDYDGIIIKNIDDTGSYYKAESKHIATDYIAFNSNQFKNITNQNPTENEDIRYSDRVTELTPEDDQKLKKHFGTTGNYNVAGYMLKNGAMLDFSGKHWGDTTSKTRQVDHRDISEVLPDESNGVGAMVNMISNGNIRLMPEVGGINLAVKPSKNQRVVLRRYIEWFSKREGIVVDIDAVGGDTIKSFEYDKGVSADRVMRDIDNYFKGGTTSELMQFHESDDVQYSDRVNDEKTISFLNNQKTLRVYRAMQIIDGKLYPPMAAKVKSDDGKKELVYSSKIGVWEQATERPDLIKNGKFELDKANGSSIYAAYNPYIHTSASPLNDQFSSAYKRDNLVVVEGEIPVSELTSGYRAEFAKDSVGETKWHSGPVASKLKGDKARRVFLSRWFKPTRIVPDSEVASIIAKTLEGENIDIPYKVVTPSLREELEKVGVGIQYADRDFSYKELVSKGSIQGVIINNSQQVKLTSDGSIDVKWVIDEVRKKCQTKQTKSSSPTYYIEVLDIDKNVVIDRESIEHNLRGSKAKAGNVSPKALLNARALLEIPEILKHSIEVNRSVRSGNLDVPYSHVMLGTVALEDANGDLEYYAVRSVVEERVNQNPMLTEAKILGRLYAINTKKVDTQRSGVANNSVARLQGNAYTYNIADLLNNVKTEFDDTFSNDVYANLGMQRTDNDFSENLQHQDRYTKSIYDIMGENEKLKRTNEILEADIERLKELVKLEKTLTHGKVFKGVSLEAVAKHLKEKATSTIDIKELAKMLNDEVYSFIANSTEEDWAREDFWAEVQQRSYNVASKIIAEAKTQTMIDDYPKMILKDIRSRPIWLSEGQISELKYKYGDRWHDRFFGKITTTKDSKHDLENKWSEWAEQYPGIFPKDTNEAEMGIELIETYDRLREASEIVMEFDTEEATRSLMAEVYGQYWNLKRFESTADKYDKRIKELRAEHKKAMTELRESYKERVDKQKLADEMYYGRKTNNLKKDYEAKLREQRKADKEKATALVKKLREEKKEGIAEAKRVGRERMSNYRTELERKRRIQSITANTLALKRKLLKNSPDEHIPEVMKPVVIAFVNALDFSSKRMLEKGIPTQKDISLYKALEKVKDMMSEANANKEAYAELAGIISDENVKKLVESAWDIKEKLGDNEFILNNMPVDRLESLDHVVRAIKYIVNQTNKFYVANHAKGITNLAQETMSDMNTLGKAKLYDGLRAKAIKMLKWGNATPYYAFKRFGEGGRKIFEAFQNGWDKFAFNIKQIVDYAKETYTDKEVKEWGEDIKTFKILVPATDADLSNPEYKPQYQEVQMTVPQIMSLYALQKREQAKGHMLGGGIRVADFETKKGNIVSQTEGAVLTQKDIGSIVGTLTDRQKAVADKLQEFMNTVCSDWGNYVSMTRFGYEAFGEENYFPIQSDDNNLAVNDATEQNNSLFRLLNMSFSKSLTENANNRIVISDIFDVFAQHTSDMAKYNALALPVLDAFRWYNYTEKAEKGDGTFVTNGVKQSIETAFGKDAQNYITTFLKDINGTQEVSRDTLGKGFYTKAKIAAVGANLRVVLLQPTSYLRANAVINPKYLTRAFAHKPNIEYAEKYCGIALWKSMGYYDTNVQKGVEDLIKHNKTFGDKATDIAMKGAEWADKVTWGYLWNACEIEIRETRSDLKSGSEEFFIEVGKRLREVIYATQVVDSTMTRSQMMRSSDGWDKMLTAFASEPTLSYNMLMDAYMGYSLDAKKMGKMEAIKKNGKRIARIVFAYTVTNALAALVESGFDALRDDDDEEKDGAYFMSLYLENFANDMSITAKIPYIKEMHSLLKGFRSSRTDTQWMESLAQAWNAWSKHGLSVKSVKSSIKAFSYASGLPFYNALRDIMATLDKTEILTTEDLEKMFSDFID